MPQQFLQFLYINHVIVAISNIHKEEVTMTIIVIAHGGIIRRVIGKAVERNFFYFL
jgi:broad specificity phosphatase PhoE